MLKEIKFYPYMYIFLWFLPFSTIFINKNGELFIDKENITYIKTDKKETVCKIISNYYIYFFKYVLVFSILFLIGAFDFKLDFLNLISLFIAAAVYSFLYFDLVIKMNIKVIFVSILFFMVIGFYFILNEKNILIIVLISINFLIPIHVIIKFIEDIRIKRDYYFLNEEKLIVEIEKEKNT